MVLHTPIQWYAIQSSDDRLAINNNMMMIVVLVTNLYRIPVYGIPYTIEYSIPYTLSELFDFEYRVDSTSSTSLE